MHFDVHPSVVFKLGEDLITDDIQALAELVKNAYDADATSVVVRIDTTARLSRGAAGQQAGAQSDQPAGLPADEPVDRGTIEIVDNGFGMTPDTLERGWLTISNSTKRRMKSRGETTKRGRTPLGDKGLGRLGAQRLGDRIEIVTSTGDGFTHRMEFDWRHFTNRDSLREVPVSISSVKDGRRKSGTTLVISALHDADLLQDRARIQTEMSRTLSPYREIEKFRVYLSINGEQIDLSAIDKRVRDASTIRYTLSFDGEVLKVRGLMRLAQLRPNSKEDRALWARIAEADGGEGLHAFLSAQPEASRWKLRPSRAKRWWVEFNFTIELSDVRPRLDAAGAIANPGPFTAEIDSFNLSAGSVEEVGVFDRATDLRKMLSDLHGIRIYRDGFNVRAPDDWLGLGKQITSGGSWYGLRPGTTMGYVAISAGANQQLTETTDREGFIRTAAYDSFEALLRQFVVMAAGVQEFVGRGASDFKKKFDVPDDTANQKPDVLLAELTTTLGEAQSYVTPLRTISEQLSAGAVEADSVLQRYADSSSSQAREREIMEVINRLSRQATQASEFVDSLESFIVQVGEQRAAATKVQTDLEAMSEQLSLTYETMAVGLTAEALAHEIGNIAERLARRSSEIRRAVQKKYPNDTQMLRFVEQVQGVVAGLRRQLAHLAPSLRYVRERRERILVSTLLAEIEEYYAERWQGSIDLSLSIGEDFAVVMNRGKLLQVFDNLILNAEYWLQEQVRLGRLENPVVTVVASDPAISIWDNGIGIDPQIEDALFEPFVSNKPRGMGRGLGLFIVRQLLDAEACDIQLEPRRNKHGRRYAFEIDLTSVVADD